MYNDRKHHHHYAPAEQPDPNAATRGDALALGFIALVVFAAVCWVITILF